jgi:hypothetical protein
VKFIESFVGGLPQVIDFTKLDRFGGTSFGTGGLQSNLLAVVTECALESAPIFAISFHHAKRTGSDAVATTVANIRLNKDSAEFSSYNGSCRARLKASCVLAMFANVGRKSP